MSAPQSPSKEERVNAAPQSPHSPHSAHFDSPLSHTTTADVNGSHTPRSDYHDPHVSSTYARLFGAPRARTQKGWLGREVVQFVGEFFGTFLFLFIAYLTAQAALGNDPSIAAGGPPLPSTLFYVSVGFGGGVLISLWIFKGISGEMFNPAITLGLLLSGAITLGQAILHVIVQLIAAICAAALVDALTPGPILFSNKLAAGISVARGVWIEALLTAQLVLTVLLLTRGPYTSKFAAVGIALSVFMGHMTGVNFTGTGINPARSLGPNVAMASFPGSTWVYYVGPVIGALIAVAMYAMLRFLGSIVHKQNSEDRRNEKSVARNEQV
jgi:aquaporin related protein